MADKATALRLFQDDYYAAVDSGRMKEAMVAFTDDVEWTHAQVWGPRDPQAPNRPTWLRGKREIEEFLVARKDNLARANIRHHVQEMIFENDKGAFIGYVQGGDGQKSHFMVWFEIRDDKIARYLLRPL